MTEHTPGPWEVLAGNNTAFADRTVYEIRNGPDIRLGSTRTLREIDANARLIAAAPDLLAALEALMGDPEVTTRCAPEAWEAADAAIALARGQEVAR